MQQIQAKLKDKFLTGIGGIFWAAGLLLAGSDGPYMPWLNTVGLILFVCSSVVLGKRLHSSCEPAGGHTGRIICMNELTGPIRFFHDGLWANPDELPGRPMAVRKKNDGHVPFRKKGLSLNKEHGPGPLFTYCRYPHSV
jgi:hypothetical protein